MRQVAIDAASIPKDAKIAALEKTSAESEKLIADARNDKMRQFEEMQFSQVNLKPKNYFFCLFFLGFLNCWDEHFVTVSEKYQNCLMNFRAKKSNR